MQSGRPSGAELGPPRGTLRDSLGALKNLDQLLRSIRVGPKAILSVLPDVHAASRPMHQAMTQLLDALSTFDAAKTACAELFTFFEPRMEELNAELGRALDQNMTAKNRLHLEKIVSRITLELDAVRELVDLLCEAASGPPVRVLLTELIEEAFKSPEVTPGDLVLHVHVVLSTPDLDLMVNPRVCTALLAHATSLVAYGSRKQPDDVSISVSAGGSPIIEITRKPAGGAGRPMSARQLIPPTEECLRAGAELVGCTLTYSEGASPLTIGWGR